MENLSQKNRNGISIPNKNTLFESVVIDRPLSLAKQRDNAFGSIRPSVSALAPERLTYDLDIILH